MKSVDRVPKNKEKYLDYEWSEAFDCLVLNRVDRVNKQRSALVKKIRIELIIFPEV